MLISMFLCIMYLIAQNQCSYAKQNHPCQAIRHASKLSILSSLRSETDEKLIHRISDLIAYRDTTKLPSTSTPVTRQTANPLPLRRQHVLFFLWLDLKSFIFRSVR